MDVRRGLHLGVARERAVVTVPTPRPATGTFPARQLTLRGTPVLELAQWCGTCPAMFTKLAEPREPDLAVANDLLNTGLSGFDDRVLSAYGALLSAATYTAMILDVTPRLVAPGDDDDYFCHEQVATWGVDPVRGAPEDPGTPYYRTYQTTLGQDRKLYEFVVPMVPPAWNEPARTAGYAEAGLAGTAVAYSLLDVVRPAMNEGTDHDEHWVLTHFLLDGHHKAQAAAATGRPLRLLSLLDEDVSLARADDVAVMIRARAGATR